MMYVRSQMSSVPVTIIFHLPAVYLVHNDQWKKLYIFIAHS